MCDQDSLNDMSEHLKATGADLSRRSFGLLAAGAMIATLPRAANALDVKEQDVEVKTKDGTADSYFVAPSAGKHPAVIVWVDAFGLRPAFRQMGKRLAESGYAVLIPNPYYRTSKASAIPQGLDFNKPDDRAQLMKLMGGLNAGTHATDGSAYIEFVGKQASVDTAKKIGTTGYCMGGAPVFRLAGMHPDRVGAAATFHGGGLVTDQQDSPHLLIPKMKSQLLVAIAENDDKTQPDAKTVLKDSFQKANVKAEVEVYPAMHGWCPPDSAVYKQAEAEKAWSRLLATFKPALA